MRRLLVLLTLSLTTLLTQAKTFKVDDFSPQYHAIITIDSCDQDWCSGAGTIKIYDNHTKKPILTSKSDNLSFELHNDAPQSNVAQTYGENSSIIFEDFNFDGKPDFAVSNGNNSCYGGPSYDIYLWHNGAYKNNAAFGDLANNYCGMFDVDVKNKQLHTMTKGSCCQHEYTDFIVKNNQPVAIKIVDESYHTSLPLLDVNTQIRVNGKMQTSSAMYEILDEAVKPTPIFSFELDNHKTVNIQASDDTIFYSLTKDNTSYNEYYGREVEFAYGFETGGTFFLHNDSSSSTDTLTFNNQNAKYTIVHNRASHQAHIEVLLNGKTTIYPAITGSIKGQLIDLKDKKIEGLIQQ